MTAQTVLVTGVAGFIGSVTAKLLLSEGRRVIGVDNLNDYYDPRLKEYRLNLLKGHADFYFERGDIEDPRVVTDCFTRWRPDAVVNLAARAGVRCSLRSPAVYLTTNALGTLNILESMRQFGVTKLVHASTSSLYAGQQMPFSEELPVNRPISPYAATKKASEMLCYTWHHLYGLDISIVRYFTVFGPAGRPDMSIYRFVKWVMEGAPVNVTGDGTQTRDFTYVDDIAAGTVAALRPLGFEVVNLGGGRNPQSINYIIRCIEEMTGATAAITNHAMPREDMLSTWANIEKAERLLDWRPGVSLEEGLRRTVRWHRDNASLVAGMPVGGVG